VPLCWPCRHAHDHPPAPASPSVTPFQLSVHVSEASMQPAALCCRPRAAPQEAVVVQVQEGAEVQAGLQELQPPPVLLLRVVVVVVPPPPAVLPLLWPRPWRR
jgi:hypothetical protein